MNGPSGVVQGHFDLVIKVYPDGNVSQHMFGLNVGDKVAVSTLLKQEAVR